MPRMLARAGIVVALLVAPAFALAAYNDVTLTTSTVFSVGGISLNVYGGSAVVQSATVNASTMTLTLAPGSSVTVNAPNKNSIVQSGGSSYMTVSQCDTNISMMGFTYPAGSGSDVTITLTPSTNICVTTSGTSGGGNGSIGIFPNSPTQPATQAVPATPATPAANTSGLSASQIQSILDVLASFNADADVIAKVRASLLGTITGSITSAAVHVFKANLTTGSLGSEVKALQEFLNAHRYIVSTSGAGSIGNETTYFGVATKTAVIKYQKAKGITPAVGYFGALTRATMNAE